MVHVMHNNGYIYRMSATTMTLISIIDFGFFQLKITSFCNQ